jgi:hypothetical protein
MPRRANILAISLHAAQSSLDHAPSDCLRGSTVGLVADDSDRSWQRSSSKGAGCGIDQPSRRKPVDLTIG